MLEFLVNNDALSEELRSRMLGWRHVGFSAHNEVRVVAEDAEGRKKLAGYMLRAPMSLEKMTYDAATGTLNLPLEEASRVEAELPSDAGGASGWRCCASPFPIATSAAPRPI
jgi:hypothetical protein